MKHALAQLDNAREITGGDLIGFMQAYNLHFGPNLQGARRDAHGRSEHREHDPGPARAPPAKDASVLPAAARDAYKGMEPVSAPAL
jgi:hypothetical protein